MDVKRWRRNIRRRWQTALNNLGIDRYWLLGKIARKESAIPHLFGLIMVYAAISMVIPLIVSLIYGEDARIWIYPLCLASIIGGRS